MRVPIGSFGLSGRNSCIRLSLNGAPASPILIQAALFAFFGARSRFEAFIEHVRFEQGASGTKRCGSVYKWRRCLKLSTVETDTRKDSPHEFQDGRWTCLRFFHHSVNDFRKASPNQPKLSTSSLLPLYHLLLPLHSCIIMVPTCCELARPVRWPLCQPFVEEFGMDQ